MLEEFIKDDPVIEIDLVDQGSESIGKRFFKLKTISHFSFFTKYEIGLAR